MSNLRQIGQGLLLYANENKGRYPERIGEILKEDVSWQVFICPDATGDSPPAEIVNKPDKLDQLGAWVTLHSTYIYVKGLNANSPADRVLAYEKPENHSQEGINVLFNDG